jgi:hypothetical protein
MDGWQPPPRQTRCPGSAHTDAPSASPPQSTRDGTNSGPRPQAGTLDPSAAPSQQASGRQLGAHGSRAPRRRRGPPRLDAGGRAAGGGRRRNAGGNLGGRGGHLGGRGTAAARRGSGPAPGCPSAAPAAGRQARRRAGLPPNLRRRAVAAWDPSGGPSRLAAGVCGLRRRGG